MRRLIAGVIVLFSLLLFLAPAYSQIPTCADGTYPVAVSGTLTTQNGQAVTTVDGITAEANDATLTAVGTPSVTNGFLNGVFCVPQDAKEITLSVNGQALAPISLETYVPLAAGGGVSGGSFNLFSSIISSPSPLEIKSSAGDNDPSFLVRIFGGLTVNGNTLTDSLKVNNDVIIGAEPDGYQADDSSDLYVEGNINANGKKLLTSSCEIKSYPKMTGSDIGVSCKTGIVVGGGCRTGGDDLLQRSHPKTFDNGESGWLCNFKCQGNCNTNTAYVICCSTT